MPRRPIARAFSWSGFVLLASLVSAAPLRAQDAGSVPVSTAADDTSADDTSGPTPNDRSRDSAFAFLSAGWMPMVTLGYRMERLWWKGGSLSAEPRHIGPPSTMHGLTGSVLFPLLASGHARSKVRVAFALGAGVDFAMRRGTFISVGRPHDPDETPRLPDPPDQRLVSIQVYAQVGVMVRAAPRGRGFVGSLSWLPTSRDLRYANTGYPSLRDRTPVTARGRLMLGWTHDHLLVTAFAGFSQSDGPLVGRERIVEAGLQAGVGW